MLAYLDAGNISMVVGTVAAGAAGLGVAIKSKFTGRRGKSVPTADQSPDDAVADDDQDDDSDD